MRVVSLHGVCLQRVATVTVQIEHGGLVEVTSPAIHSKHEMFRTACYYKGMYYNATGNTQLAKALLSRSFESACTAEADKSYMTPAYVEVHLNRKLNIK